MISVILQYKYRGEKSMKVNEAWNSGVKQAWDDNDSTWSANSRDRGEKGDSHQIMHLCEINFPERGHVLDIGCGNGYSTALLQAKQFRPIGIDVSSEMIRFAQQAYPEMSFHQGDIQRLPYEKETFDGILMINVIE